MSAMIRSLVLLPALACLAFGGIAQAQSQPTFPALSGRIVDEAHLLSPQLEAQLTEKLAALERDTSDQLVVVTVNDLQDREIEEYGYQLGRAWKIGQTDEDNGALLIIAPNERKVRIEVGYGLEGILTDALSTLIIQNEILPSFRTGGYEAGITRGVAAIDTQLRLDPAEARVRAEAAAVVRPESAMPIGPGIVIAMVFVFIVLSLIGSASGRGRRRRGMGGTGQILLWAASAALSSRGGGGGGWSGGGGGGFSGGGGGFGGGGASGGW